MGRKVNLNRDEWTEAAFDWVAEHGWASLAVEPLARSLGVSKGGFYWCFANRDALSLSVLERWEALGTKEIIRTVEQATEPAAQVRALVEQVVGSVGSGGKLAPSRVLRVQHALMCASNDPLVRPVVERVTEARIKFLVRVLKLAGLPTKLARQRATLGYASYVGLGQLVVTQSDKGLGGVKREELVDAYLAMLMAPAV